MYTYVYISRERERERVCVRDRDRDRLTEGQRETEGEIGRRGRMWSEEMYVRERVITYKGERWRRRDRLAGGGGREEMYESDRARERRKRAGGGEGWCRGRDAAHAPPVAPVPPQVRRPRDRRELGLHACCKGLDACCTRVACVLQGPGCVLHSCCMRVARVWIRVALVLHACCKGLDSCCTRPARRAAAGQSCGLRVE